MVQLLKFLTLMGKFILLKNMDQPIKEIFKTNYLTELARYILEMDLIMVDSSKMVRPVGKESLSLRQVSYT